MSFAVGRGAPPPYNQLKGLNAHGHIKSMMSQAILAPSAYTQLWGHALATAESFLLGSERIQAHPCPTPKPHSNSEA